MMKQQLAWHDSRPRRKQFPVSQGVTAPVLPVGAPLGANAVYALSPCCSTRATVWTPVEKASTTKTTPATVSP